MTAWPRCSTRRIPFKARIQETPPAEQAESWHCCAPFVCARNNPFSAHILTTRRSYTTENSRNSHSRTTAMCYRCSCWSSKVSGARTLRRLRFELRSSSLCVSKINSQGSSALLQTLQLLLLWRLNSGTRPWGRSCFQDNHLRMIVSYFKSTAANETYFLVRNACVSDFLQLCTLPIRDGAPVMQPTSSAKEIIDVCHSGSC